MRFRLLTTVAAAVLLLGGAARADSDGNFNWSGISATTAPTDQNVFTGGVGFPGATFDVQHGMSDMWDIGGRLDLDYAPAYNTDSLYIPTFQGNFLVPMRFKVFHQGMMNLQVNIVPGFFVTSTDKLFVQHTSFGLAISPGAVLSFDVLPNLKVGPAIDLPMGIDFLNNGGFTIAALFGGSIEWMVVRNLSLGLNMRFGLTYSTEEDFGNIGVLGLGILNPVQFALVVMPTISYRF